MTVVPKSSFIFLILKKLKKKGKTRLTILLSQIVLLFNFNLSFYQLSLQLSIFSKIVLNIVMQNRKKKKKAQDKKKRERNWEKGR